MDFSKIGFKSVWHEDEDDAHSDSRIALVYLVIFCWLSVNLLVGLIRTIGTNPGNIPEDIEWDMD
jgi:hypothetical protein